MKIQQQRLFLAPEPKISGEIEAAIRGLALDAGIEVRGAVFTRLEVVEFILDLVGYTADKALYKRRLLEPSFGRADFLIPAIRRLYESWLRARRPATELIVDLGTAVCAVELHQESFDSARAQILEALKDLGASESSAVQLVNLWLRQGDFLLIPIEGSFDFVIGNPPYVRQELIPNPLLVEYRRLFSTMYDRADLYVPFIEKSLRLLAPEAILGFICADRWVKNRYGGPLRRMISESFHLRHFIDMTDTPAFSREVIAYPAVTIIAREQGSETRLARKPAIESEHLRQLSEELTSEQPGNSVHCLSGVVSGSAPWILDVSSKKALVRRLESEFPLIEETGCKIGIGVATGADRIFIGDADTFDVEADRKLPLAMTRDIQGGAVSWLGKAVINPFGDDGRLVELEIYPKLRAYLLAHQDKLKARHCAKKAPAKWYRTIDRIHAPLTWRPKLLIPDIKGEANVVYEPGQLYPHHNLYYIVSDEWDLQALQMVLKSGIAHLFVETYSTKMRGGYFRFQAQYLRRIRLPRWSEVSKSLQHDFRSVIEGRSSKPLAEVVGRLYSLSSKEVSILQDRC